MGRKARETQDIDGSFNRVASALARARHEQALRSVLLFAVRSGDGTTSCALATARRLQRNHGLKVLVVAANHLHQDYRALLRLKPVEPSLTPSADAAPTFGTTHSVEGLFDVFIPAESAAGQHVTGYGYPWLREFVAEAAGHHDLVLIDGPPVAESSIALELIPAVSAGILILPSGGVRSEVLARLRSDMAARGQQLFGIVMNKYQRRIPDWLYRRWFQ